MKVIQLLGAALLGLVSAGPALAQITPGTTSVPGTPVPSGTSMPGSVPGSISTGTPPINSGPGVMRPDGTVPPTGTVGSPGTVPPYGTAPGSTVPTTGPGGTRRVRRTTAPTTTTPVRP